MKTRLNHLPRKSKLRGMKTRLEERQATKPADTPKFKYHMPGSMNPRGH